VTGKLISAPSPDEYHDAPRRPLPHYSQSHKRHGNQNEATSARHSFEEIEQPHYPLDPNNESECWSESEHEPELEDVRNTPYSGQSRECDEPEEEYDGESCRVGRAPSDV
jgi:hypothetical protein